MTAKVIWIDAITQRPVIRCVHLEVGEPLRLARRSARRARRERPIVLPSRIPETESDSCDERRDVGESTPAGVVVIALALARRPGA